MQSPPELLADIDRARMRALIIGVIGIALCGAGGAMDPVQFHRSYLYAFAFFNGLSMGCLALTMLQHLTGGVWGLMIRRIVEAGSRTFPLTLILFIPVALGVQIFPWAGSDAANDAIIREKSAYLNVNFFYIRAAIYFVIWIGLSMILSRMSAKQDAEGAEPYYSKMSVVSAPGILLYAFTVTFASIDWIMSLDPHWYSTIFGILLLGCQGVATFAFAIMVLVFVMKHRPMSEAVSNTALHDLGKLMFAFVMLYAYFNLSQFLIIWSGNLPEENPWYLHRMHGGWEYMSQALVVLHFIVPFLLLLSRNLKRTPGKVTKIAALLFVMQLANTFWLAMPSFFEHGFHIHWLDIAAPVAIGGLWMWFFFGQLKQRPLLPVQDPMLQEALTSGRSH
jgi:hypothetical protein